MYDVNSNIPVEAGLLQGKTGRFDDQTLLPLLPLLYYWMQLLSRAHLHALAGC